MLNNSNDKLFSTDNLDDAMKELLDICQQYNDKFSKSTQQFRNKSPRNVDTNDELRNNKQKTFPTMNKLINDKSNVAHINAVTNCDKDVNERNGKSAFHKYEKAGKDALVYSKDFLSETDSITGSVEMLQQRQSELQSQLDEVIKVAKELELRQEKKKFNILQDESSKSHHNNVSDDEDSELIEFQQIENELRISELNRQLSKIQEELRLRLYKRLISKTTGSSKISKDRQQHAQSSSPVDESPIRRDSTVTNEPTPPSSSCSNEHTATSCISTSDTTSSNVKAFVETDLVSHFEQCLISKPIDNSPDQSLYSYKEKFTDLPEETIISKRDDIDSRNISNTNSIAPAATQNESNNRTYDLKPALNHGHDHENITAIPNSDRQADEPLERPSRIPVSCSSQKNIQTNSDSPTTSVKDNGSSQAGFNGFRNCLTSNDLGRIDEGEEDDSDYYANSNVFRSIYEEKISPMILAADIHNQKRSYADVNKSNLSNESNVMFSNKAQESITAFCKEPIKQNSCYQSPKSNDYRFNIQNINSAKRSNRPLTIYMPKSDDDVDLVKLVQSQGHDLDIISSDLRITPTSAHGYLYKSCSSNSKKWLKRYFYFDRNMETLSYYENEEQLVKKNNAPKCIIPFDEIGDVYVDHRLSELSEKQKGSKRKSYVFILATIKRKYVLASTKAETMRAWIDILFKAARANDYFNEIENDEYLDSLDPL